MTWGGKLVPRSLVCEIAPYPAVLDLNFCLSETRIRMILLSLMSCWLISFVIIMLFFFLLVRYVVWSVALWSVALKLKTSPLFLFYHSERKTHFFTPSLSLSLPGLRSPRRHNNGATNQYDSSLGSFVIQPAHGFTPAQGPLGRSYAHFSANTPR